jgi:anti-anti-sigma factor
MEYVKINHPVATVAVTGQFKVSIARAVQAEIMSALSDNGCTKVVVDFSSTTFIDSSIQGLLIGVRRKIGSENFSAKGAKGTVLSALKAARLDEWLQDN